MDYDWVTPRIAVGSRLDGPSDVKALVDAGITDVLDADDEFNDGPLLANSILVYCWNPTADDGQPKPVWYWASTLRFALPMFAQPNRKLYLHCYKGINRGPSNAAAVMMALGWSKQQARQQIQANRPEAGIRYLDNAAAAVNALGYTKPTGELLKGQSLPRHEHAIRNRS